MINDIQQDADGRMKKSLEKLAQEFAREYYDWSRVIDGWIQLILG